MCRGDDASCPDYEKHVEAFKGELNAERRSFLKSSFVAAGGLAATAAGGLSLVTPALAQASLQNQPAKRALPLSPGQRRDRSLGLFQQDAEAAGRDRLRRFRHHRDADPSRRRRSRPHGQGRSRRRERLSLDQGQEGREPPRRRPVDASLKAAARARAWACTSDRAGVRARRRAGRHSRGAHRRCRRRALRQSRVQGQDVRHQRRGVVGLPLQRPDRRAEGARGRSRSTRWTPSGERNWAKAVYNFQWVPQTDPFGVVHKTIDYPGVPVDHSHDQAQLRRAQGHPRADPSAFRRARPRAEGGGHRRYASRRAIPAATSTTGASARARRCTTRSRFRARCSRSAIRMPRRATANCAAPPSNAR